MIVNIKNRMLTRHNTYSVLILLIITICHTSCKKFVEIPPPTTSLVTANVFDKNSTATAAQLSIYAQMQTYPGDFNWQTGLSSDELKNYSSNLTSLDLYANSLDAVNDGSKVGVWQGAYNFIYQANAILEALPNSPGVTDAAKKQLTGESKFLRAFWNFYLVNLYGDIPLVLTTDYTVNSKLARTSKDQVYQQIITDLTDAQALLNTNFVDETDTAVTTERVRPTKWAASALLARVYLYSGDWAKAENAATLVINNTSLFKLPTDLNTVFLKNSPEAIWQLMPSSQNKYTREGSDFILTVAPTKSGGSIASSISTQLMNSFESGDTRKTKWIGTYTDTVPHPHIDYYFPYKYKAGASSTSVTEYSMVFRLAEQYLIRAEARTQQNNLSGAAADLNTIRNRAGLANTSASSQNDFIVAIAKEKQVELFTEGHRWFDLKRTNAIDTVMTNVAQQKGNSWHSYQQLYPIPYSETQNAINVSQNPGY